MHFLGLNGMPRRIPDYPDAYQSLNVICSFGSLLSLVSLVVFLVVIYDVIFFQKIKKLFLKKNI
jgi:cytochrome c oxidase subunit 1